jgi:hypothetical protein
MAERWDIDGLKAVYQFLANFPVNVVSSTGLNKDVNPLSFSVGQNYPNTCNPSTSINYTLPEISFVSIKVFNLYLFG